MLSGDDVGQVVGESYTGATAPYFVPFLWTAGTVFVGRLRGKTRLGPTGIVTPADQWRRRRDHLWAQAAPAMARRGAARY